MPKVLKLTRFGNPILRQPTKKLTIDEIKSEKIQSLIADMRHTVNVNKLGVAIAATQVGQSIALSIIGIKVTANRPEMKAFDFTIINPKITQTFGEKQPKWEGCISCGTDKDTLFGLVPRYKKIKLKWLDENAVEYEEVLSGFVAHLVQHEVDHLDGVLFVDRVEDSKSYMMADEYRERIINTRSKKPER